MSTTVGFQDLSSCTGLLKLYTLTCRRTSRELQLTLHTKYLNRGKGLQMSAMTANKSTNV